MLPDFIPFFPFMSEDWQPKRLGSDTKFGKGSEWRRAEGMGRKRLIHLAPKFQLQEENGGK